ncbi:MAG: pyruvate, water dikinase regulatory protein [Candidatus Sedimenticola sp. (ex Thyasira tokunagai)]
MIKRTVFFVSESTGITAETLGHSLLSQFEEGVEFRVIYMPFISTEEKAYRLVEQFEQLTVSEGIRPIVFATMAEPAVRHILEQSNCRYIELFDTFISPLSEELGVEPSGKSGLSHGMVNGETYEDRMRIINFAMVNDDGARLDKYDQADVILVGVSRTGKTPTCLYLAMHFGLRAANYPLTEEDFEVDEFSEALLKNKEKLVALTIDPTRLNRIREERRPGSPYASLARCYSEVKQAQRLFNRHKLLVFDTTSYSIEEVSSKIVKKIQSNVS